MVEEYSKLLGDQKGKHSRYMVLRRLGVGNTVSTYIVRDVVKNRTMAAKILNPVNRPKEEAKEPREEKEKEAEKQEKDRTDTESESEWTDIDSEQDDHHNTIPTQHEESKDKMDYARVMEEMNRQEPQSTGLWREEADKEEDTLKPETELRKGCFGTHYAKPTLPQQTVNKKDTQKLEKEEDASQVRSFAHDPLRKEFQIINTLNKADPDIIEGILRVSEWIGIPATGVSMMLMELLGPDLSVMLNYCGGRFSPFTTVAIAKQMVESLRFVHDQKYLHCDLKPENWVTGILEDCNRIILADFGTAKKYIYRFRGGPNTHISFEKSGHSPLGTPRFMSARCHAGSTLSRRDDMESLTYLLVYFLKGKLPWSGGAVFHAMKELGTGWDRCSLHDFILRIKGSVPIEVLCKGLPWEIIEYTRLVTNLGFKERPAYETYLTLFEMLYRSLKLKEKDLCLDWLVVEAENGIGGDISTCLSVENDDDDWVNLAEFAPPDPP